MQCCNVNDERRKSEIFLCICLTGLCVLRYLNFPLRTKLYPSDLKNQFVRRSEHSLPVL